MTKRGVISLKHGFHLSPHAVAGNTEEALWSVPYFQTLIGSSNLVKNLNRSDFKISKQISSVTV